MRAQVTEAVSGGGLPLAPEGHVWDSAAARKRIAAWAEKSGGEIDFTKYRRAFLWYDADKPEQVGSYKLPVADVIEGKLQVVWKAVAAVAAVLQGARGGVQGLSDADTAKIKSTLAGYYRKFKKGAAPWAPANEALATAVRAALGDGDVRAVVAAALRE